ncbi:MAG TPA: thiolase family protein [Actinomycetota bacterium]|nr:thiolase family protein [Actinomycetota bacterium]
MREAVVVDAVRTPLGRRNGKLKNWHPVDLLAHVLQASVDRTGVDPLEVDDVIAGCVSQVGEQSCNIARNAWLAAGFPVEVPGTTVDRQCGSSQQAVHFAAQGVMSGAYDLAIACGVENMSRVPMGASLMSGPGFPFSEKLLARHPIVQQGLSAEMINERWAITREELDRVGFRSQTLAAQATAQGRFAAEIVPVPVEAGTVTTDEGIRETSLEKMASLKPAFAEDGKVTAGNSSQITDGAASLMITTPERARSLGLRPRARFKSFALAASDPVIMLTAPIPATQKVLKRAGLTLDDIGVVEINEAFASVVVAWAREMGLDPDEVTGAGTRVNPNGGAIALGHPLGASGARLMTTMLHELERTGARFGLQTMCEGGGMANATIIERLD